MKMSMNQDRNIEVFKETKLVLDINKELQNFEKSVKYKYIEDSEIEDSEFGSGTRKKLKMVNDCNCILSVQKSDNILDTFMNLIKTDCDVNPVLVSETDATIAGCFVNLGLNELEEELFRRTNYLLTMKQDLYPLFDSSTVYSPDVSLFRNSAFNDYKYTDIRKINIIASAPIKYPVLNQDTFVYMYKADKDLQYKKIEMIFKTAILKGHDCIVSPVYGCSNRYNNPLSSVVEMYKKIYQKYSRYIKKLVIVTNDNDYNYVSKYVC